MVATTGPVAPGDPAARAGRLYRDLERFARGFVRAARCHGPAAARSFLGAWVEWLGVDLADAFVQLPRDRWAGVDALADELGDAFRAYLDAPGPDALAAVAAVGERAGGEGMRCTAARDTALSADAATNGIR